MQAGEEDPVSRLALRSFDEYVGPGYAEEGIREIHEIFSASAIRERQGERHFILVAEADGAIVGMIEVRDNRHISMLFVDPDFLRRGIGRELLRRGIERARAGSGAGAEFTVHSSPYAVPVYRRLGFVATGEEQTVNGIRFVPMRKEAGEEP
jgi:ribosomal protein S18 acetylase RimI-like enzyme